MSKEMVISANPHETRVAILEEGQLCEYYVEREKEFALVGSIYKGRVTRVLPGMQSAFVEIGLDSDAFLYVSDFLESIEDYDDQIAATVEEKVQKIEEQGGRAFPEGISAAAAIEPADVESAPLPSISDEQPSADPSSPAKHVSRPPATPSREGGDSQSRHRGRGHFDDRNRSRFGRRGNRRGGGGRFNRPGGRGGGRLGGDLPSSKYASPRSYEERGEEQSAPPEGYVPIVLPGESLAKYKEKPKEASPSAENSVASTTDVISESANLNAASVESPKEPAQQEPVQRERVAAPELHRHKPVSTTGLEPLPGESIARWRTAPSVPVEPAAEIEEEHPVEVVPSARLSFAEPEIGAEVDEAVEVESDESAGLEEMGEYDAQAIAEHVAEAQSEVQAREIDAREGDHQIFTPSSPTQLGEEREDEIDEEEEAGSEAEEEDLIEEEADAEGEGMIAPPETETAEVLHGDELAAETAAPASEQIGESIESADAVEPGNALQPERLPQRAAIRDNFRPRMQQPGRQEGGRDRGRRDDRGRRPHHHGGPRHQHAQPRRPQLISELLKQGQEIIVQIAKEPLGKKGARITSHVVLPGRYLVYMPTLDHTGVSRKIASPEERSRLRHLVNEAKGTAGGGFIVRTAAASAPPEDVRSDVQFLTRTWAEIKGRAEQRKAPSLLHRDLNLVERILRDFITPDFNAIWVDSEEEYAKVVEFMSRFQPALVGRVKLYSKATPVFEEFGIQQEIDKGLRPKVWLKSGGYIVINHTEALVAIDVNTGKFVGKGSTRLEDTIVRTNLEAVKEIVRQMRLRDLGGIIIIDFIDMEERRNREKVMAALEEALRADRAPSKVLRFNEFGLIAITRKRTKQALERTLCQPCPYCTGSGMVKSIPTLCYEIQIEARKMAPELDSASVTLRVHPEVAKAFKTREASLIEELERWTRKSIIIQSDPTLHWEQYDIY